jgi:hypothetical protein
MMYLKEMKFKRNGKTDEATHSKEVSKVAVKTYDSR